MNKVLNLSVALWASTLCLTQAQQASLSRGDGKQEIATQVVERGPHHRTFKRLISSKDANITNAKGYETYTEVATGMHYYEAGEWKESNARFEIKDKHAVGICAQHKVIISPNIASPWPVDLLTSDGKRMQSQILGLGYTDRKTGLSVLIAEICDSVGQLDGTNRLVFPLAFKGCKADVVYEYTRVGFVQDVIIREQLPSPEEFDMESGNAVLQIFTEWLTPPQPTIRRGKLAETDDTPLSFGAMQMPQGRAFKLEGRQGANQAVPVRKAWHPDGNNAFLIESVDYPVVKPYLKDLPRRETASLNKGKEENPMAQCRNLSLVSRLSHDKDQVLVAKVDSFLNKGFVLDYTIVNGFTDTFVFKGDETYFVSDDFYISDSVVFEGGSVIKYAPSTGYYGIYLDYNATIQCATGPYRPVVFTSQDDDTVGAVIDNSTGNPSVKSFWSSCLFLSPGVLGNLSYLRFSYANIGIWTDYASGPNQLRHAQFIHCDTGIYGDTTSLWVGNALFYDVGQVMYGVAFSVVGEHWTVHQVNTLVRDDWNCGTCLTLTNSILACVTNLGTGILTTHSTHSSSIPEDIFQTVGSARHYLVEQSNLRNTGSLGISPVLTEDFQFKTTYPPVVYAPSEIYLELNGTLFPQAKRDRDVPDLGYHYDPLDYVFGTVSLTNSSLTISPGTAVGCFSSNSSCSYSIEVSDATTLIAEGEAEIGKRIYFTRYNTVQEQANSNWTGRKTSLVMTPNTTITTPPILRFRFTEWSVMAREAEHINGYAFVSNMEAVSLKDSVLRNGTISSHSALLSIQNCLFDREHFWLTNNNTTFTLKNNLFLDGEFNAGVGTGSSINCYDNQFVYGAVTNTAGLLHNYNAYANGFNRLTPTSANDVLLATVAFDSGSLGDFYQPSGSSLINSGSIANAATAGYYHYTTTANQVKETTSRLDIGLHWIATLSGLPADGDGDGIPDYLEDTNGNGEYDASDLSNWTTYTSKNKLGSSSQLQVFTPLIP